MPALDILQSRTTSTHLPWWKLDAEFTANGVSEPTTPFGYTALGSVSGPLVLVDGYGCNVTDFPPSVNTAIALISRGTCTYGRKSAGAWGAGALAALIYNNESEYLPASGTLVVPGDYVPTTGISKSIGGGLRALLENNQTVQVSVSVTAPPEPEPVEATCASLSDQGRAFSTVLSVFVGAVLSGLTAGFYAPSFSVFAVWLGPARVVSIGIYQYASACVAIHHNPLVGSHKFDKLSPMRNSWLYRPDEPPVSPTVFGWIGWTYMLCYAPLMQAWWLAENMYRANSNVLASRALAVLVTVMPLTIESRAGYGQTLWKRSGRGLMVLYYFMTASATVALGCLAAAELINSLALMGLIMGGIFGSLLAWVNFFFGSPEDEGEAQDGWRKILGGLAMGVLCGLFVGAPALVTFVKADSTGATLLEYLRCSNVAWWKKMVAILP